MKLREGLLEIKFITVLNIIHSTLEQHCSTQIKGANITVPGINKRPLGEERFDPL